jgi:DNA-binding transcriptional ArsR family regulator
MSKTFEKIFGSRIRAKTLGWLFTHPEESFFVRQMAMILGEDPTNVSREMAKLEELGLLRSKRNGNLKHFKADQQCPFFEELKGLVLKTTGVAGRIRLSLNNSRGLNLSSSSGLMLKARRRQTAMWTS